MPQGRGATLNDVAVLTRALENVLRKLIRFTMGKISLVKLQEMIRVIFVEEAENFLRKEHPKKNVSLTKLALMSGLDTRTLTKIRNSDSFRRPFHGKSSFLVELMPGAVILDVWTTREPYFDEKRKKPKTLKLTGAPDSFESLFAENVKSRGVTASSLLNQLKQSGSVTVNDKSGTVTLVQDNYLPVAKSDQAGVIEAGFTTVGNLIETVEHNANAKKNNDELLYQRSIWTYRLSPKNQGNIRKEVRELLTETNEKAQDVLRKYDEPDPSPDQMTAGISFFYFEEEKS